MGVFETADSKRMRRSGFSFRFQLMAGPGLLWVLSVLACSSPPPPPAVENPVPAVVAKVNGEAIPAEELDQFLDAEALSSNSQAERLEGLRRLVRQKVVAQEARKAGFTATEEEARALGWIPDTEIDERDFALQRLLDYLVIQKMARERLNAEEEISLRTLMLQYERNLESYEIGDQYRVLEILVQDRQEAESIRAGLEQGDFRGFRDWAQKVSTGVGAESGGDLGLFEQGQLPPRFEEVIFELKVGQISDVFQSELGFHIFMVEELIPRHYQKFYEVMEEIFEQVVAEQERQGLDKLVNQMIDAASIEIIDPTLSRDWRKSDAQLP